MPEFFSGLGIERVKDIGRAVRRGRADKSDSITDNNRTLVNSIRHSRCVWPAFVPEVLTCCGNDSVDSAHTARVDDAVRSGGVKDAARVVDRVMPAFLAGWRCRCRSAHFLERKLAANS